MAMANVSPACASAMLSGQGSIAAIELAPMRVRAMGRVNSASARVMRASGETIVLLQAPKKVVCKQAERSALQIPLKL